MTTARERMLEILRGNVGFDQPEAWVDFGLAHAFKVVQATRVSACPECGTVGVPELTRYVYYSTLHRLRECPKCGLIYADARIDPRLVQHHFEATYKDEEYFRRQRGAIFAQIAALVDRYAPRGGRVIDVGGAKGHLMAETRRRRPDLECTVNDLSRASCDWAAATYGFRALCGPISRLVDEPAPYDVAVMSDVLYYEPDLAGVWAALPRIVRPGGSLILRVPNKLTLMRTALHLQSMGRIARRAEPQVGVRFFNPEHLYVFSRHFLKRALANAGFGAVRALPSRLLGAPGLRGIVNRSAYELARLLSVASGGAAVATPAMLILATDYQAPPATACRGPAAAPFDSAIRRR
jgi:SAM-dependent methyltransferase